MYKEVLSGIQNISIYPLFSLTVFFLFFLLVAGWMIRSKKEDFEEMVRIPLNNDNEHHQPEN